MYCRVSAILMILVSGYWQAARSKQPEAYSNILAETRQY